jgi:hypothetical protein
MRVPMVALTVVLASALPVTAAPTPLAGLHDLIGSWKCTYRAGAVHLPYDAAYTYDLGGRALREITSLPGSADEELVAYDERNGWTAVVFDDHGNATVMRAKGSDPRRISYRSTYPDGGISVRFDLVSSRKYTLRATVRSGGKTTASIDTCLRTARRRALEAARYDFRS